MFDEAVVCNSEKDQTKAQSETGSSISFTSWRDNSKTILKIEP
jgi:hypothetical protein